VEVVVAANLDHPAGPRWPGILVLGGLASPRRAGQRWVFPRRGVGRFVRFIGRSLFLVAGGNGAVEQVAASTASLVIFTVLLFDSLEPRLKRFVLLAIKLNEVKFLPPADRNAFVLRRMIGQ